ncbi:MAG: molybdenum cofactor biosynthesis protein B [Maricaulaceae bacterium]
MSRLDPERAFVPLNLAVMTVSDTRTLETDKSGGYLAERIEAAGHVLADRAIIADDRLAIRAQAAQWIAARGVDGILTTGGTGLTGRDVTPEAIEPLFDKRIEGFAVLFHQVSFQSVGVSTLQSRATAGLAGGTFVFCLPGSTGACRDAWEHILVYEFDSRHRPCNLAELKPRLNER